MTTSETIVGIFEYSNQTRTSLLFHWPREIASPVAAVAPTGQVQQSASCGAPARDTMKPLLPLVSVLCVILLQPGERTGGGMSLCVVWWQRRWGPRATLTLSKRNCCDTCRRGSCGCTFV